MMTKRRVWAVWIICLLGVFIFYSRFGRVAPARPKLLLVLVIDQFRADYLMRFESRFMPAGSPIRGVGGFKYLMENSAYFPLGQYNIAQSITAPGHATILSGAYPYQTGITFNAWFNREKKKMVQCTEDPAFPVIGV